MIMNFNVHKFGLSDITKRSQNNGLQPSVDGLLQKSMIVKVCNVMVMVYLDAILTACLLRAAW